MSEHLKAPFSPRGGNGSLGGWGLGGLGRSRGSPITLQDTFSRWSKGASQLPMVSWPRRAVWTPTRVTNTFDLYCLFFFPPLIELRRRLLLSSVASWCSTDQNAKFARGPSFLAACGLVFHLLRVRQRDGSEGKPPATGPSRPAGQ